MRTARNLGDNGIDLIHPLRDCRGSLISVAIFSALINVLYLTGSFYMLQVYDRVIPGRSVPTLIALSILAGLLFFGQAALDYCRSRILIRIGRAFHERMSVRIFGLIAKLPLTAQGTAVGLQPVRDLDTVRSFLTSGAPLGFFDLPWMPFYVGICFMFHPMIGIAALLGALTLVCIAFLTEMFTRKSIYKAAQEGVIRQNLVEATRRNAEVVAAMGMSSRISSKWAEVDNRHSDAHQRASDVAGAFSSISKASRMAIQSGVLGVGAYLVIRGEASAGVIIAASILSARALAPIEQIIAHWRTFSSARQSWFRMRALCDSMFERNDGMELRRPSSNVSVENVYLVPPGSEAVVVNNVSFTLNSGTALAVVGQSGSGKSSLARALAGIWTPARGAIRLDGATLSQWAPEALGGFIGYLPQDVELFAGTIRENIARFDVILDSEKIIRAAEQSGVHDLIIRFPEGYDTKIGEGGMLLSGGQRQLVALARALYNDPFLVILDEPNSNLDSEGEQALSKAITNVKERGGIVVVVAHRATVLTAVDYVLVMAGGDVKAFGPRDEVLRQVLRPTVKSFVQSAIAGSSE